MKLLIATRNPNKLREIRAILSVPGLDFVSLDNLPDLPEVEEDGLTFEANAGKKAATLARLSRLWALADDSGLEVDALGGEPGVRSARYAGEPVSYAANNAKLLRALQDVEARRGRFRCVVALSSPDAAIRMVEGCCEGTILREEKGMLGFGYDPLFVPSGYAITFAEMDGDLKNSISHRAKALQRAIPLIENWVMPSQQRC